MYDDIPEDYRSLLIDEYLMLDYDRILYTH